MAKKPSDKLFHLVRVSWTEQDQRDFETEIQEASDRAAALIATAYLEDTLEFVLRAMLVNRPSDGDEMILFGTSGALSSFAAKIRLAHLLGVFGEVSRKDLLYIATIRNKFAHSPKAITFLDGDIATTCKKLKAHFAYCKSGLALPFKEGFQNIPDRIKFLSTCMDIDTALRIRAVHIFRMRKLELRRDTAVIRARLLAKKSVKALAMKHQGIP